MKRRKFLRYVERHGAQFLREGGKHTIYIHSVTRRRTEIPRHPEVNPHLVRKICRDLGIEPPLEK